VGAFLVAYAAPLTFPTPWGEILVDFTAPSGELLGLPLALGDPAVFALAVPEDLHLASFVFYTQAIGIGGTICLHCAHECTVGY